jgi:hypothetical protein
MYRPAALLLSAFLSCSLYAQDFRTALYRYMPLMRFDSSESFFPVRAKSITDNPGNRLERENNATLATRNPDGTGLNIGYLVGIPPIDTGVYPHIIQAVLETDDIDEQGSGFDNARDDAQKFQTSRSYRDRIYGHVHPVANGAWLEYWFFYYYNHFIFDDHEGDWEMIQVFVNNNLEPQAAVYAQHSGNSWCPWAKVPKERGRPVVFVAIGSHASYFSPGDHSFFHGLANDHTDGNVKRPIKLIRLGEKRPRWVNWPGSWGASKRVGGPKFHDQWADPQKFYENADLDGDCK